MKKQEKTGDIVVYVIIALLVIAGIGIYMAYKARLGGILFDYNGFQVKKVRHQGRDFYDVAVFINDADEPTIISIREDPRTFEDIPYASEGKELILEKEDIFMTMEPEASGVSVAAYTEFKWIIENIFGKKTQGALTELIETAGVPKKTCDDVDDDTAIVLLRKAEENRIHSEGGCVIIDAVTENDRINGVYRLTLTMLGVMKE